MNIIEYQLRTIQKGCNHQQLESVVHFEMSFPSPFDVI